MSPRRNPDRYPSHAPATIEPARFLSDGRAVFNGDPLPDDCQPGDIVLHNGRAVGIIGLDGRNRVQITTPEPGSMAAYRLDSHARLTAALQDVDDAAQCVDLSGIPEEALGPVREGIAEAERSRVERAALEETLGLPEGARITRAHLPHVQDELDAAARRNSIAAAHEALERASGLTPGAIRPVTFPDLSTIQPIDPAPFRANSVIASVTEGMAGMSAQFASVAANLQDSLQAAERTDPAVVRARLAEERLRDVRRTLDDVRRERDDLRAQLTRLNAGAERVGLAEAKAAARAWKETPLTDSVAKRDSFLHLLDTLEQLAR